MENDLISRKALEDVILNDRKLDGVNANWEVNRILVHIHKAPTAEQPQGEWIENPKTFCWKCDNCGNSALYNKMGVQIESQFCPNCGADMRGEKR